PKAPDINVTATNTSLNFTWEYPCPYFGSVDYILDVAGIRVNISITQGDQCTYNAQIDDLKPYNYYNYSLTSNIPSCDTNYTTAQTEKTNLSLSRDSVTSTKGREPNYTSETYKSTSPLIPNKTRSTDTTITPMKTTTTTIFKPEENCSNLTDSNDSCQYIKRDCYMTNQGVPSEPTSFSVTGPSLQGKYPSSRTVSLSWKSPDNPNGDLSEYLLEIRSDSAHANCT
ncbi:hypothetical protein SK128_015112, partial [Halocaridina rubra]